MESQQSVFDCPNCRGEHPWAPAYVGKLARCSCGQVLRVPAAPRQTVPPPMPLAYARPAPRPMPQSGGAATATLPPPVPAMRPPPRPMPDGPPRLTMASADDTLDPTIEAELAETGAYGDVAKPLAVPDPFRDSTLPGILLAVGALLVTAQVIIVSLLSPGFAVGLLLGQLVNLVIQVGLMLAGVLLAAKIAGIYFGDARIALFKLAAIYVGPTTLGGLVTLLLGGDIAVACIGWGVSIICYWFLLSYLFRLDGQQTTICVAAITGVRMVATFLLSMVMAFAMARALDQRLEQLTPGQEVTDADVAEIQW